MTGTAARSARNGIALVPSLNAVQVRLPGDGFLLSRFEAFYQDLVRLKRELTTPALGSTSQARLAQQELAALLRKQETEVERICSLLGTEMYRQAQRVMACLADEILGSLQPDGGWTSLESELFYGNSPGGFSPGAQCLNRLEQLLQQCDPVYRELATAYYYAIALIKKPAIAHYLEPLSRMIAASESAPQLFAQSYAHTLAETKVTLLPSARKWLVLLGAIVLAWSVLSWALWMQVSAPVKTHIHEIRRLLVP
ncbi:MAG TPA: hypothetical protein VFY05_01765 [Candidatus Angelobacter sp.]|nr:hypothetical protein [Candidatus Angelobacter sp.]